MQNDMTRGNIFQLLIRFTLPLLVGNIFQQLYNMADTIIVGRFVGTNALAAVGSTGTIMFLMQGFATGMTTGFAVLTAQRFGAHDEKGVRMSVANGMLLTLILGVVLTTAGVISMPAVLRAMSTPDEIFVDAQTYITIICGGLCATMYYNLFSAFLQSVGNSKTPLFFLVFAAILNVFLDLFFIIHFHMGVAGAALATIMSQGVSAILCFIFIIKKVRELVPKRQEWRLTGEISRKQLGTGFPMALQSAITASGTMVMQAAINRFGATAVAAYTAASKVGGILMQGPFTMGQAMSSYCGQNYGSQDLPRIKKGVWTAFVMMFVFSLACFFLAPALMPVAARLFFPAGTDMKAMMHYANIYINISKYFYIPLAAIFIFRAAMQGCGYAFLPTFGGVLELVSRFIVAAISVKMHSYTVAVFCDPAAWIVTGIFDAVAFLYVVRQLE